MEDFWNRAARDKNSIRYRQAKSYSPYSEFFGQWREEKNDLTYLTFNAFYRFDSIMEPLFSSTEVAQEQKEWLFDLIIHYLIEVEFRGGASQKEYGIHGMMAQIAEGEYGQDIKRRYLALDDKERYYIAYMLLKQRKTGASVEKYSEVLATLLEKGIVYKNKLEVKELLLYVGKKENESDAQKIKLANELFQPLGYRLKVFWDKHFAVFGEKQTMQIDEIELL